MVKILTFLSLSVTRDDFLEDFLDRSDMISAISLIFSNFWVKYEKNEVKLA